MLLISDFIIAARKQGMDDATLAELLRAADTGLYKSKKLGGRNAQSETLAFADEV